jgi:hypothetical protein
VNKANRGGAPFKLLGATSDECLHVLWQHPNRAAYAYVSELATVTEAVDSRGAHGQPGGDFPNRQERLGRNRMGP